MKWGRAGFAVGVVTAAVIGCTSTDIDPGAGGNGGGGGTCPCVVGNSGIQTTIGCGGRGCVTLNGTAKGVFCDATGQHDDPTACTSGGGGTLPDGAVTTLPDGGSQPVFEIYHPCTATASGQVAIASFDCTIAFTNASGFITTNGGAYVLFQTDGRAPMSLNTNLFLHDNTAPFVPGEYTTATASGDLHISSRVDGGDQDWAMKLGPTNDAGGGSTHFTITSVADNSDGKAQYYIAHGTGDLTFPCDPSSVFTQCTAPETLHVEF